jgi:hypothetical protein
MCRKRTESGLEPKLERAAIEDSVHRSDDRASVGCDRGQCEQAHAGQTLDDLVSAKPPLRGVDPQQVRAGGRVASVKKILQRFDISRRLVHTALNGRRMPLRARRACTA